MYEEDQYNNSVEGQAADAHFSPQKDQAQAVAYEAAQNAAESLKNDIRSKAPKSKTKEDDR